MLGNVIAVIVIVLAVGGALAYIIKEKRRGVRCIGCPDSGCCSKGKTQEAQAAQGDSVKSGCGCGCHGQQ